MTSLAPFLPAIARRLSPPPAPPTLVEFAGRFIWTEGTAAGDPIDPRAHPAQFHVLTAIGDGLLARSPYRRFVILKPTQDGGTWMTISMPLIYCTTQLARPFAAGMPDMRLAGIAWRQKIRAPILKAKHAEWLPTDGPGSDGNSTPVEVSLCGTPAYFMGGGAANEAGQASLTAAVLARDELDSMDPYVAELMTGRLDAFAGRAVVIDTSTIKHDEGSTILAAWQGSTAFRLAYACPHCDGYQVLDWERVTYDASSQLAALRSARLTCCHCGVQLTDADRLRLLDTSRAVLVGRGQVLQRDGTVTGAPAETLAWGLLWTALDSPIKSLGQLAAQHWDAARAVQEGDHARMRRFFRDRLCRPYLADQGSAAALDAAALALRSAGSDYERGRIPAGAEFLTAASDVQKRELWWAILAHAKDGRWWLVDWGRVLVVDDFRAEPTDDDVHAALDKLRDRIEQGWQPVDDGADVPMLRRGIDVGYQADAVRAWLTQQDGAWSAVRGAGDGQLSDRPSGHRVERIEGWVDVREVGDAGERIHFVEVDHVKDVLAASLARQPGQPGAGHLPRGLAADDWVCRHLTAEKKVDGKWVRIRKDNHLGDCAVYDLALAKLVNGEPSSDTQAPAWGRR
jgi:phage terminase large subunit GpA-like protein